MEQLRKFLSTLNPFGNSKQKNSIQTLKKTLEIPSRRSWDVSYKNGNFIAVLEDEFVISDDEQHSSYTENLKSFGDQFYVDGNKIKCLVKERHLQSLIDIINTRKLEFMKVINDGVVGES